MKKNHHYIISITFNPINYDVLSFMQMNIPDTAMQCWTSQHFFSVLPIRKHKQGFENLNQTLHEAFLLAGILKTMIYSLYAKLMYTYIFIKNNWITIKRIRRSRDTFKIV